MTSSFTKKYSLTFGIGAFVAIIASQAIYAFVYPHGCANSISIDDRPACVRVDPLNDNLRMSSGKLRKIRERPPPGGFNRGVEPLLRGPETVVFDAQGTMYVLTETATLVSLTDFEDEIDGNFEGTGIITAKATSVADLGLGRPLGGKFHPRDGCLYFADAVLGLARRCFPESAEDRKKKTYHVELLTTSVVLDDDTVSPIIFADDLDVGSKTGHIYFSDASHIPPERIKLTANGNSGKTSWTWDVLTSSITTALLGKKSGRLLRYKPETGETDVLFSGIYFANGVAVDGDETYVLVNESFAARTLRYHLTGAKAGTVEVLTNAFPGFTDGVDCSPLRGTCFVAVPTMYTAVSRIIFGLTSPLDRWVQNFVLALPKSLTPGPKPYGGVAEVRPEDDGDGPGKVVHFLQDPDGRDVSMITAATFHYGKLYLGSLHNDFVGVYDLD